MSWGGSTGQSGPGWPQEPQDPYARDQGPAPRGPQPYGPADAGGPAPWPSPAPPAWDPYTGDRRNPPPGAPTGNPYPPAGAPQPGQWPGYQVPEPGKKRTGLIVGLTAAAVLVAGGTSVFLLAGGGSPSAGASAVTSAAASGTTASSPAAATAAPAHSIVLPVTAGPLTQLVDAGTTQRAAQLKSSLGDDKSYPSPLVAFYRSGSSTGYRAWILLQPITQGSAMSTTLTSMGPANLVKQLMGAIKITDAKPIGQFSGGVAASCGHKTLNSVTLTMCVWIDDSSFAWTYFEPSVPYSSAVADTLALREAAEQ